VTQNLCRVSGTGSGERQTRPQLPVHLASLASWGEEERQMASPDLVLGSGCVTRGTLRDMDGPMKPGDAGTIHSVLGVIG
jgi:hypothetical protein